MSTWELINPSDQITFTAESHELACIAVGLIGEGKYGATELEGAGASVPLWLFGGTDQYFQTTFGRKSFEDALDLCDKAAVADVYDSFLIASFRERAAFEEEMNALPEIERPAFKADWQNKRRGSLNNICHHASLYAAHFRKLAEMEAQNGAEQV